MKNKDFIPFFFQCYQNASRKLSLDITPRPVIFLFLIIPNYPFQCRKVKMLRLNIKKLTIQEFAEHHGICLRYAYKVIKQKRYARYPLKVRRIKGKLRIDILNSHDNPADINPADAGCAPLTRAREKHRG